MQRGVHEAIDYRKKDWEIELNRLTKGRGVALITDPLGGNHWRKSYRALRSTGRLGMFGISVATASKLIWAVTSAAQLCSACRFFIRFP